MAVRISRLCAASIGFIHRWKSAKRMLEGREVVMARESKRSTSSWMLAAATNSKTKRSTSPSSESQVRHSAKALGAEAGMPAL